MKVKVSSRQGRRLDPAIGGVQPRYAHDCSACIFMGRKGEYDMYYCSKTDIGGGTVLARLGDDPADYASSSVKAALTCQLEQRAYRGAPFAACIALARDLLWMGAVNLVQCPDWGVAKRRGPLFTPLDEDWSEILTLEAWERGKKNHPSEDGEGYWMPDKGRVSRCSCFGVRPSWAVSVAWYAK